MIQEPYEAVLDFQISQIIYDYSRCTKVIIKCVDDVSGGKHNLTVLYFRQIPK